MCQKFKIEIYKAVPHLSVRTAFVHSIGSQKLNGVVVMIKFSEIR